MNFFDTLMPKAFRATLTTPMRVFYACTFLSALGLGLTLSFYVVYLHNVRHFSAAFATLLLAAAAVAGLVSGPLWGTLVDRFGPFRVSIAGYGATGLALVAWAFVTTRLSAAIVAIVLAVVGGASWGPNTTLLARLVGEEHRQRAFGFNFMLLNLGIGFGGLISAAIVNLNHPATFSVLYLCNAAGMFAAGLLYLTLRSYGGPVRIAHDDPARESDGWRTVLADRRLVQYLLASLVLMIGGYGSQEAGYSLFVVNNLRLSVHDIGVIFFFNTTTIVLAQLWTLNRIEGRSRTRVLAVVGALWCFFWLVLAAALAMPPVVAFFALCASMVVFAFGETMLQPVGSALVNEIAPEHLRGRYNAASGATWSVSGTVAPLIATVYFGSGGGNWWPLSIGILALVGSALMLNLRRSLALAEDGRTA